MEFVHSKVFLSRRAGEFAFSMNVLAKGKGGIFWFGKIQRDRFWILNTVDKYWEWTPGC